MDRRTTGPQGASCVAPLHAVERSRVYVYDRGISECVRMLLYQHKVISLDSRKRK